MMIFPLICAFVCHVKSLVIVLFVSYSYIKTVKVQQVVPVFQINYTNIFK